MPGDRIEQIYEEYQRQRNVLSDLHRQIQEISVTAVSARKEVSVTVNHAGTVTDIAFNGTTYRRHAAKDLSALVMKTIAEAKQKAMEQSADLLGPLMPTGINARDLLSGRLGLDGFMPSDGPRLHPAVREQLQR
jgi:DNA-binding protein YbaB